MSVWFCIPSKRPRAEAQDCIDAWRAQGYLVAIHRDTGDETVECDYLSYGDYHGYAKTVNGLIREVMKIDADAQWFVTGGDDTLPDQNKRADEIGHECGRHFGDHARTYRMEPMLSDIGTTMARNPWGTFGVMQPTGDRYAGGSIDRIAGSPWIGREFAERTYGGNGPYWHEYLHMFVDEEIKAVAEKLNVYWMRPDLTHFHNHFMRKSDAIDSPAIAKPVPEFLREANSPQHWDRFKRIFDTRRATGFPGALPT